MPDGCAGAPRSPLFSRIPARSPNVRDGSYLASDSYPPSLIRDGPRIGGQSSEVVPENKGKNVAEIVKKKMLRPIKNRDSPGLPGLVGAGFASWATQTTSTGTS
jgi:hypothetical protein